MTKIFSEIIPGPLQLHVNNLHAKAETRPFTRLYASPVAAQREGLGKLTPSDHYHYLVQYKCIYEILIKRVKSKLPEELNCLLRRVEDINADLTFLTPQVKSETKDRVLATAQSYADYLAQLDLTVKDQRFEFLGHFLTAILADLNGGQFVKRIILNMYNENGLKPDDHLSGIAFYTFPEREQIIQDLTKWLKSFVIFKSGNDAAASLDAEVNQFIARGVIKAFGMQIRIMDELQSTRCPSLLTSAGNKQTSYFSGLFNVKNTRKAATVIGLAVAGIATIGLISRMN